MSEPTPSAYWFLSNLVIVHVSGEETEGRFSLLEFLTPPDDMTPLHVHRRDSQTTFVLDGEVTIYLPGVTHVVRPGECVHLPAGIPQTERVTSAGPARLLDINSPAGFDKFVAAIGVPTQRFALPPASESPDPERLTAIASDHGIDVLGPPGLLP